MKRITAIILVLALLPALGGICHAEDNSDPLERIAELEEQLKEKEERIDELEKQVNALLNLLVLSSEDAGAVIPAGRVDETDKEPTVETVSLNEKFTYQDFEITLEEARIADHVMIPFGEKEDTNAVSVFRPVSSEAGNMLLIISGKIKNTGTEELFTQGNIFADFKVDETDTYGGKVTLVKISGGGASTGWSLASQMETKMYITAELTEETAESFTYADIVLGFHRDGFETTRYGASMKDADTCYQLTVSKEDETSPIIAEKSDPATYHLGEAISTETIDLNLTEIVVRDEMSEPYNGKNYRNSDPAEGTKNLCLVGTFTNRAKRELIWTKFSGNVEIDGYKYSLESWLLDGYRIQPMMETRALLFANVPDSVLENLEQATFRFAFNEEMSNLQYEYEECDYSYVFTFGAEDIMN